MGTQARRRTAAKPDSRGAVRLGPPVSRKILYSLITLALVFVLLETGARVFVSVSDNPAWSAQQRHFTAHGFPDLDRILVPDRDLFWRLEPGLSEDRQTGRMAPFPPVDYSVSTDEEGHRRTGSAPGALHTVLFLGDSRTFGWGIDDDRSLPSRLQQALPEVQSINAAVPGYSAYQGRVQLERAEFEHSPRVVVISFGINAEMHWASRSDLEHAESIAAHSGGLLGRLRFVDLLRRVLPARDDGSSTETRPRLTDQEFGEQLRHMVRGTRARGAEPVLMSWPLGEQMTRSGITRKQHVMRQVARDEDVPLVDLVPVFRAGGGARLFLDPIHPNEQGCELAARHLAPVVSDAIRRAEVLAASSR